MKNSIEPDSQHFLLIICSSELEVSLGSGNDEACIASFVILKETYENVEISECTNLKNYIRNTLRYWYDQIEKKIVM